MIVYRLAWVALISVIILVIAGATVRVTGSGLGCPDWPTCWGCLIPPTSPDQIDVDKLDLDKFKRHAKRKGIDPDTITRETVLDSFDPVHTWIEFCNRLATLPLGLATLLLAICSLGVRVKRADGNLLAQSDGGASHDVSAKVRSEGKGRRNSKSRKWWIVALSWFCLIDVLANAIMGAIVVRSGLQPGIITLHMALAFLLIAVLVTLIWMTRPQSADPPMESGLRKRLLIVSLIFFGCLFCEGLMGSQLREQTDELTMAAEAADGLGRDQWVEQLASTFIFKLHRTFSWTLLVTSGLLLFWIRKADNLKFSEPKLIFSCVIAMMIMGIVLGHVAIYQVVQVLHVGATAVLLAITWHWVVRLIAISQEHRV